MILWNTDLLVFGIVEQIERRQAERAQEPDDLIGIFFHLFLARADAGDRDAHQFFRFAGDHSPSLVSRQLGRAWISRQAAEVRQFNQKAYLRSLSWRSCSAISS